jgi:uncharacterized protein YdeI (YjbR/CyaY-like superfamily)
MRLLEVTDAAGWREWLATHHDREREIWLVFWKVHTGRRRVTYEEAVEEALCFGWIDSIVRRLDEERYAQKFTPRSDATKWSASNRARLRRLIAAGRMAAAGLARVCPEVLASLASPAPAPDSREPELGPEVEAELRADGKAWQGFQLLPPSQRRLHVRWIMAAKRDETRRRRLAEVMGLLAQGKRLGLK